MTAYEIYKILVNYGVPIDTDARKNHAQILVAVAKSESGLRADAVGDGGESIGIFQIRMPSHANKLKELTGSEDRNTWIQWLKNPVNNTIAASRVYHSQGLGAWTEYKNGNYKNYLDIINDSNAYVTSQGGSDGVSLAAGGRTISSIGARGDGSYEKAMEATFFSKSDETASESALPAPPAPQVSEEGSKVTKTGDVNSIKERYVSEFARVAINYDLQVAGANGANVPEVIKDRARNLGKIITAAEKELSYKYPRSNINKIYTR